MSVGKFISIGTKGTSIPTELHDLEPPLTIGRNLVRWAGKGSTLGIKAHAWVSKKNEQFELYRLDDAIRENKVIPVGNAKWKANGKLFTGQAFFPSGWAPTDPQPSYVAVISNDWPYGSLERDLINDRRNRGRVGRFIFDEPTTPSHKKKKAEPKRWTKNELLIALNVYRKLSFGQLDERNRAIIDLAKKMGRTPGSLAMKLCNFASLDPVITSTGRKGLDGASDLDKELWKSFLSQPSIVIPETESALRQLFSASEDDEVEVINGKGVGVIRRNLSNMPTGETTITVEVEMRRGQDYFRQVILNSFNNRCCVSGIPIRSMLIASHILPWSEHPKERLNPANGLCLSRIHDIAFDRKLITFDEDYRLVLSKALKDECSNAVLKESFSAFEGKPINLPEDTIPPNKEFLAHHRSTFAG